GPTPSRMTSPGPISWRWSSQLTAARVTRWRTRRTRPSGARSRREPRGEVLEDALLAGVVVGLVIVPGIDHELPPRDRRPVVELLGRCGIDDPVAAAVGCEKRDLDLGGAGQRFGVRRHPLGVEA